MNQKLACRGPGNGNSIYSGLRSALVRAGYTTLPDKKPSYAYEHPLAPVAFTSPTEHFDVQIGPSPRSRGLTYDVEFGVRLPTPRIRVPTGNYTIVGEVLYEHYSDISSLGVFIPLRVAFPRRIGHERIVRQLVDIVQREHAVLRKMGIVSRN